MTKMNDVDVFLMQESVRNTTIKDSMRDSCVTRLAESWLHIMVCITVKHDLKAPLIDNKYDMEGFKPEPVIQR